jgi:hypothetical protein
VSPQKTVMYSFTASSIWSLSGSFGAAAERQLFDRVARLGPYPALHDQGSGYSGNFSLQVVTGGSKRLAQV